MTSEARGGRRRSSAGCLLALLVALVVLAALVAAGLVLWGGLSRSAGADVNPALSPVRRAYLELYLSQRAADLEGPAGSGAAPVEFTIAPGQGAAAIAENLRAAGLLNDTELFLNYLSYYGLDGGLVAGEYQLDPVSYTHLDVYKRQGWRRCWNMTGAWSANWTRPAAAWPAGSSTCCSAA